MPLDTDPRPDPSWAGSSQLMQDPLERPATFEQALETLRLAAADFERAWHARYDATSEPGGTLTADLPMPSGRRARITIPLVRPDEPPLLAEHALASCVGACTRHGY